MSKDKVKMAVEYAVSQLNRANNGKYFKNQKLEQRYKNIMERVFNLKPDLINLFTKIASDKELIQFMNQIPLENITDKQAEAYLLHIMPGKKGGKSNNVEMLHSFWEIILGNR